MVILGFVVLCSGSNEFWWRNAAQVTLWVILCDDDAHDLHDDDDGDDHDLHDDDDDDGDDDDGDDDERLVM